MTEFPVIHTNVWDVIAAVPAVLILTQILKRYFHIPGRCVPSLAGLLGMGISIFISHPHHLSSGIFMVFFTAVQQLVPILRLRLRSWLTAGDQSMGINQHKKNCHRGSEYI
jgi:NhaP-type Na+/H+ or K+/H+ antiporter